MSAFVYQAKNVKGFSETYWQNFAISATFDHIIVTRPTVNT